MRSLTTLFNTEKNKKTGAKPVWILKCPFVAGTLYLSDRIVTYTGITIKPWIASWGSIDEDLSNQLTMPMVSDFSVDIIIDPDAATDIHDLLWSETVETIKCELYLWFEGLTVATDPMLKIWTGNIIDFERISELVYNVRLVDESVRVNKNPGNVLSLADYPLASLDSVGYTLPIIYGEVENVPVIGLDVAARTTLPAVLAITGNTGLSIGSTTTKVAYAAFSYNINSNDYSKAADAVGVTPGDDVITASKYGAVAFDIGTNGTVDAIEATDQAAAEFATEAEAIAALPVVADSHIRMGYVTATKSDGAFTFGTTAFNAAGVTAAFTPAPPSFYLSSGRNLSSGDIIVIESEEVYIITILDNLITEYTRGYNNTAIAAHAAGVLVQEKKMDAVYMFADHPVKSIGDIYAKTAEDVFVDITDRCMKYTGQGGVNDLAGYEGKAVFSVPEVLSTEVTACTTFPEVLCPGYVPVSGIFGTPLGGTVASKYFEVRVTATVTANPVASENAGSTGSASYSQSGFSGTYVNGASMGVDGETRWAVVTWNMSLTTNPSAGYVDLYVITPAAGLIILLGRLDTTGWHPAETSPTTSDNESFWYYSNWGVYGVKGGGFTGAVFTLTLSSVHRYQTGTGKILKVALTSDAAVTTLGEMDETGWHPESASPVIVVEAGAWKTGALAITVEGGIIGGDYSISIDSILMCQTRAVSVELSTGGIPFMAHGEGYKDDAAGTFTGAAATSQYPPAQSDAYVKATTKVSTDFWPYYATDPTKSLVGAWDSVSWATNTGSTNQRFHIDLGSAKIITRVYYENCHHAGANSGIGVKNFTLWGSNSPSSFAELTYGTDTGWTQLTTSQATFDRHTDVNAADPKYIAVTNAVAYRYYAFKFADNWGWAGWMGVRRIELQSIEALIERPDHIFKHFLYTYTSWPVADFSTDAATPFAADSYAFSMVINTRKSMKEWLAYMALQCRCWFRFAGGKAYLLYRPDSISSDKTITAAMTLMNPDNTTSIRITRSPLDEILNLIHVYYQRDWTKSEGREAYQAVTKATDATSIAAYGEKEKSDTFLFDFIRDATMAADLRDFYLARYKDRKKVVTGTVFLDNTEIEFADGVTFAALSNLICEVRKVGLSPGSKDTNDRILLTAREY